MHIGWDWASEAHDVTVINDAGEVIDRWAPTHDEVGIAATNQLCVLLERHWPGATAIFARLDSDIALAFLDDYPTPASAARLGAERLAMFCRRHSYSGRRNPEVLLSRLRAAPEPIEAIRPETLTALVRAQSAHLRSLLGTLTDLDGLIRAALVEHSKAGLLAPMPRIGEINLAQIVAEIGPILDRALDIDHACAEVGAVPVTRASGKGTPGVSFRWAVKTRARQALMTFADNSRHNSPWAAQLYAQARARGKRHPHAIRILARAWMRVIWACWHTNTAYNPARHRAEQRLAAA
jgi:hypothetical protein